MLERFQEQNSGNAAVWMPNVSAALHTKDWRAVDAALEKMASGTHFDDGIYAHTRAGVLATLARGLSSDVAYAKFEAGLAVWPSYANDVSRACKSRSTSDSEMRKTCVRIGKLMQASGSLRDREIGDEVIVENAAAPSERSAAALDRGKVEWQERQLYDLELLPDCDHALARLWVAALHKSDSYADMATIILDARGISLTPPQGWKLPPPQAPPPPYTCSQ